LRVGKDLVNEVLADNVSVLVEEFDGEFLLFVEGDAEAEAEFSVIFEEGVSPSRTAAFSVVRPRRGGQVTAVNRGATRGVGNDEAVAEELGEHLDVWGFTATCASAGEFEERTEELHGADVVRLDQLAVDVRQLHEELPCVDFVFVGLAVVLGHVDGLAGRFLLVLSRADVCAEGATCAVFREYLDDELVALPVWVTGVSGLSASRSVLEGVWGEDLTADGSVRADSRTLTALDTGVRIPDRDFEGQVTLFVLGGTGWEGTVDRHLAGGQVVAIAGDDLSEDVLNEFRSI
jgi:hypothetical protein